MKINLEIDCTPEEARRFLGLPDLAPMQEAVLARMQQRMLDAVSATGPEALLKAWMPMMPQTPEQMRDAMTRLFTAFAPASPGGPAGGSSRAGTAGGAAGGGSPRGGAGGASAPRE